MKCRLHLAEAASNKEIEQQLAKPWSENQVGDAFASTLAGWKARSKSKRMKGDCALMKLNHPHHFTAAAVQHNRFVVLLRASILTTQTLSCCGPTALIDLAAALDRVPLWCTRDVSYNRA